MVNLSPNMLQSMVYCPLYVLFTPRATPATGESPAKDYEDGEGTGASLL